MRAAAVFMSRHPLALTILSLGLVVILVGSVLPPPSNWFSDEAHDFVDVDVRVGLDYHAANPFQDWTINAPDIDVRPATWLNLGAWWKNTLFLGFTSSQRVDLIVTDPHGNVLATQHDRTGDAGPWTTGVVVDASFRLPPGEYELHVDVVNEAGQKVATRVDGFSVQIVDGVAFGGTA